jgi:hypothetical protein
MEGRGGSRVVPSPPIFSVACCLLPAACCLMSAIYCRLSAVCYLLSTICCLLPAVYISRSAMRCPLYYLRSAVCCNIMTANRNTQVLLKEASEAYATVYTPTLR